jgi:RNA polymerase sigma-70 factor (ECF subfamily)
MSDTALIADILGGNTSRFSALVERYLPLVRGICASHVYDPAAQDDLVQESFLAGYLGLNRLRNPERFGPWLARIARHKCLTWLRSRARHEKARERMAQEAGGHAATPDPVKEATRREMCEWARREIARLPERTREAMVLCYLEGYQVAEAARLLGVRESAVKKRLQYGRQLVGETMLREFGERPAREEDDDLKQRVLMALPLTAAPWKGATSQAAAAAAGTAGALSFLKIAGILLVTLLGAGVAVHRHVYRPAQNEPVRGAETSDQSVATAADPARPAPEKDSAAATGRLALQLRYRMRGGGVPSVMPVPGAHVLVRPLRPNRQIRKVLIEDTGLDPRFARALMDASPRLVAQDGGHGRLSWRGHLEKQGITPDEVACEKAKLLKLVEKYGEKGVQGLLDRLVVPAPAREGVTGVSAPDGTIVFPDLAPGRYRVTVTLTAPESVPASPAAPRREQRETGIAATDAVSSHHEATGIADVVVQAGTEAAHTIYVTDTISQIKGSVVDAETGEPVGLVALFASGEALGGVKQRVWVGAEGVFDIPPSTTGYGPFTLAGDPSGFIPITVEGIRRPGKPVNVVVPLERRPTISGYVRRLDGSPAPGVSILRRDVDGGGARGVAKSDEEGCYWLSHDGGVITLYAQGTMSHSDDQTFELEADASAVHDFTMPATATVYLDIRTDEGDVPEKIDMEALRTKNHSRSGGVLRRDGDRYVIPYLEPGRYHLVFAVKGYETVSETFTIDGGLMDREIPVRLVRSENLLMVKVVDAAGEPKAGAHCNLMLVVRKYDEDGLSTGSSSSSIAHTQTNEDGLATFDRLAAGSYSVYCQGASEEVDLPHAEPVVLSLEPAEIEPGILYLDHTKARAFDALRNDFPLELEEDMIRVLTPAGVLERRRLEIGENLVFAFKSGYPPAVTPITLTEEYVERKTARHGNLYDEPFELVFGAAGAVYGVVESASGERRASKELQVFPAHLWDGPRKGPERHRWRSFGRCFAGGARSAEDGTFQVRFLPPGTYVIATSGGSASEPFTIVAGREVGPIVVRP